MGHLTLLGAGKPPAAAAATVSRQTVIYSPVYGGIYLNEYGTRQTPVGGVYLNEGAT